MAIELGRPRTVPSAEIRPAFSGRILPYLLLAPQLAVVVVFFLWPAASALLQAFYRVDAFGLHPHFAGLANFQTVFSSGTYGHSVVVTVVYAGVTTGLSMALGLSLAVLVDGVRRARAVYRTLFSWTYAVPAAVGGSLWLFMFNPQIGVISQLLERLGIPWNLNLNVFDAMAVIVILTVWQQAAYNFLFFTAGLQAIPQQVLEAAALDGAGPIRRFFSMTFPLLSPTTFYLLVVNVIYVFFSTFAIVNIVTQGGPHNGTQTLVYRIYLDAFQNSNTSLAAAETVLLMVLVTILTALQFRSVSRRVHYQ